LALCGRLLVEAFSRQCVHFPSCLLCFIGTTSLRLEAVHTLDLCSRLLVEATSSGCSYSHSSSCLWCTTSPPWTCVTDSWLKPPSGSSLDSCVQPPHCFGRSAPLGLVWQTDVGCSLLPLVYAYSLTCPPDFGAPPHCFGTSALLGLVWQTDVGFSRLQRVYVYSLTCPPGFCVLPVLEA